VDTGDPLFEKVPPKPESVRAEFLTGLSYIFVVAAFAISAFHTKGVGLPPKLIGAPLFGVMAAFPPVHKFQSNRYRRRIRKLLKVDSDRK
jgi:hypothetical protein